MLEILILNGPNLNLLGKRQPEIYGHETLDDVARMCREVCTSDFTIRLEQSNHESTLIDLIHQGAFMVRLLKPDGEIEP